MTPKGLVKAHAVATLVWVCLIVPTVIFWSDSILWLGLMSVWANVVSHATAWQAARAEKAASDKPPEDG